MLKNDIRFLGVGGSKQKRGGTSCVQVADNIVIDAGNIIHALGEDAVHIEHIFLTHSHLDHIVDIAFLVDNYYHLMQKPLKVYGLKETLKSLKEHLFNNEIWPNFQEIELELSASKAIEFIEIELYEYYKFEDVTLKAIPVSHTVTTCAYVIEKATFSALYATDTYMTESIWESLDLDFNIDSFIIDVSFPSRLEQLAYDSKHLTPKLLAHELKKLKRDDIDIYVTHLKPAYHDEIAAELQAYGLLGGRNRILRDKEYLKNTKYNMDTDQSVMQISTALSQEKDLSKILEIILHEAISYTNSEGGTIYLKEEEELFFKALVNSKLNIKVNNPNFPTVRLYPNGKENRENVSAISALKKMLINIPDVYTYNMDGVRFDGVKKFDKANNYKTKSMLVIPMINQDEEVVGVIQLINKKSADTLLGYSSHDIEMTTTYANWAASAITKNRLIDDLEGLLFSFLESISVALSAKSPYGYGHIARVAELMKSISKKIDEDREYFHTIHYDEDALKELEIAAWMHDIGKISTPEHILDKATKLETIYDRIHEIEMRFAYYKSSLKAQMLEEKINLLSKRKKREAEALEKSYHDEIKALDNDLLFIQKSNEAEGFMRDEDIKRLEEIASKSFLIDGETRMLLSQEEVKNLSIIQGTLTQEERMKINEHAKVSNEMLGMLTFPKKFSRVKEIASAHHEKLNGKGYPLGLKAEEISFEGRLMAIVDVFEALTAHDRPYKKPKTIEETFQILEDMVAENALDGKIVQFLKETKAYEEYAKRYLLPEQLELTETEIEV